MPLHEFGRPPRRVTTLPLLTTLLATIVAVGACGSSSGTDVTASAPLAGTSAPSAAGSGSGTLAPAQPTIVTGPATVPATLPAPTDGPQAPQPDPSAAAQPTPSLTAPPTPTPVPTPSPAPTVPVGLDPAPKAGRFELDLFRREAFVAQYTADWCVAASMQMMANLIAPDRIDRSREWQRELYILARQISPWTESSPGASIVGWMGGLEQLGYGRFQELADPSMREALRMMARQMRFTNKPAGLWVWDGDHAWVVSGFKSTADPAFTDDFDVTAVWVEDPWSGRVSSIWGAGRRPHTMLTTADLRRAWTPFASIHRPQYGPEGMFVVIAPIA